jgi:hypothetical protein
MKPTPDKPGWPPLWLCGVHLAALWTIAFVEPLFDLLGKNAAFFVARDNTSGDVLIFAFVWALGPPLAATLIVALARAVNERLGRVVHLGFVTALAAVLLLQVVKGLSPHASVVGPLAVVLGLVAAAAYARFAGLRSFVSILGVAPIVVLALLLVFSPVKDVVFPSSDASAAASGAPASNPVPVVLMIFDELPTPSLMTASEHVDAQRYPNFARLARTATWYKNASSVSDGTYVAVPAILTGKRPQAELPTSHSYPDNLFTLVGRTYAQHDQEPITHVCPDSLCGQRQRQSQHKRLSSLANDLSIVERRLLLPKGMADKLPPIDRDWEDFNSDAGNDGLAAAAKNTAEATKTAPGEAPIRVAGNDLPSTRVKQGRAVVQTMKPGGRKPGLWMVHYVIPHVPWRFLPDGSQYVVSGPTMPGLNDQTWGSNRFLLDQAFQRHLEMLRFGDRLLGDAIDQMQRTGLWNKALVIVVADHGGAVGPKESRRPVTKENFPQVGSVPFFVKLPGQRTGSIKTTLVTTLDVVPTIAKVLGIHNGWHFDGKPVDEPHHPRQLLQRNGRLAKLVGVTPQDFLRRRDAEVQARDARWPAGLAGIWKIGPRPDLVGKPLSSLAVTPGGGAFLNNAALYRHVKPTSGVIPAYVTGSTKGVRAGTALAVAINGTIRATGVAYREHGAPRFSMLVPPHSLRRGRNQVEVLAVSGDSARELAGTR